MSVATPLAKARSGGAIRTVERDKRPLAAGVKVWKGGAAACVGGYFQPASGDPNEIVVGRFYENVDNSTGANGAKFADVQHLRERTLFLLDNDDALSVVVASRELPCSFLDDHTVTAYDPAKGSGATVYDVTAEGVWVEFPFPSSPDDAGIPRIQQGTSTLVAGTKTITGVKLTANSRILITMKDPGAGAITAFAALDAPAASRNTGTGQFVVNAINDSAAVIATAVCTFDYLIIG